MHPLPWKAVIGAVEGKAPANEILDVARNGTPVSYGLAEVIFEDLSKGEKWYQPLHVFIGGVDFGPAGEWGDNKPARPAANSNEGAREA